MRTTAEEFQKIEALLPVQRGNVRHGNLKFLNAILYVAENGCKWGGLSKDYGNWNPIYRKANRRPKSGTLERVPAALQKEQAIKVRIERASMDSTGIKPRPGAHGAPKKTGGSPSASPGADGAPSFMWLPRTIKPQ